MLKRIGIAVSLFVLLLWVLLMSMSAPAHAGAYVYQYSEHIRILLTGDPCSMRGHVVVALRDDGHYVRGCYEIVGDKVDVRWSGGEENEFPEPEFKWVND